MDKEIKELAEKICHLTTYGGTLHPNDIMPDIKDFIKKIRKIDEREITRCFKKYFVRRPNGNCQVLFALTELDDLVEEIISKIK